MSQIQGNTKEIKIKKVPCFKVEEKIDVISEEYKEESSSNSKAEEDFLEDFEIVTEKSLLLIYQNE